MSFCLGLFAHPVEGGDVLAEGLLEVVYKSEHLLLGGFREVLFYVHLADCLTKDAVGDGHCPLPAGPLLLDSAHLGREEVERSTVEFIAECACAALDELPGDIVLQHLEIGRSEVLAESLEIRGLADYHLFLLGNAPGLEIGLEVEAGVILLEVSHAHGVVACRDIPLLLPRP